MKRKSPASLGRSCRCPLLRDEGVPRCRQSWAPAYARVQPTDFRQRPVSHRQISDLQIRTAMPSDRGDVEPIAAVIHLPCLELLRFQLAKPAALEDGVGKPLVHLPRHISDPVPTRARTVNGLRPDLAHRVVGGRTDVFVQASASVVLFPLVPNRAYDDVVANDLEEHDVARATEWNNQLARATIAQLCPTA
jgi:hypothetical protein